MKQKYLFGPVPSRRLGVSLGVDLIPHKTCTLDCVYCECGQTNQLTTTRKNYFDPEIIIKELDNYLSNTPPLDYITFAGSGEPTLNSGIKQVIDFLKSNFPAYQVCLLTNGTLFTNPEVRQEVMQADLIIPSLDAATKKAFELINRPHPGLDCKSILEGLVALRREFSKEIWLEIFIVPGINDTEEELLAIKEALGVIRPDKIQVGTLDRPGTEDWVKAASLEKLNEIKSFLEGAELISQAGPRHKIASFKKSYQEQIVNTLARRPSTAADLEQILNLHQAELQKYLNHLLEEGLVETTPGARGTFFKLKNDTFK